MRLFRRKASGRGTSGRRPTLRERRAAARTAKAERDLRQTEQKIHDLAAEVRARR